MGSHLVEALVKRGEQVRALVRPGSKTEHLDQLGIELSHGDLGDIHSLRNAAQNIDIVYNCAALAADWGSWDDFEDTNIYGALRIANRPLLTRMAVELVGTDQGFSIEKAQRDLNYTPNVDFEEGMQHVKDWLLQIGYI